VRLACATFARKLGGSTAQQENRLIELQDLTGDLRPAQRAELLAQPVADYPCNLKPLCDTCHRERCQLLPAGVDPAVDCADGWEFRLVRHVPERQTTTFHQMQQRVDRMASRHRQQAAAGGVALSRVHSQQADASRFPGDRMRTLLLENEISWTLLVDPPLDVKTWEIHLPELDSTRCHKRVETAVANRLAGHGIPAPPVLLDARLWRELVAVLIPESEDQPVPFEFSRLGAVEKLVREYLQLSLLPGLDRGTGTVDDHGRIWVLGRGTNAWVPSAAHVLIDSSELAGFIRERGRTLPRAVQPPAGCALGQMLETLGLERSRPRDLTGDRVRTLLWRLDDMTETTQRMIAPYLNLTLPAAA
jgi:hypothetical protein